MPTKADLEKTIEDLRDRVLVAERKAQDHELKAMQAACTRDSEVLAKEHEIRWLKDRVLEARNQRDLLYRAVREMGIANAALKKAQQVEVARSVKVQDVMRQAEEVWPARDRNEYVGDEPRYGINLCHEPGSNYWGQEEPT